MPSDKYVAFIGCMYGGGQTREGPGLAGMDNGDAC